MNIVYANSFRKSYDRLPQNLKGVAGSKERLFREYPFHMGLRTHKLHGRMDDRWAFSINSKYRIIFEFVSENLVRFLDIGTHDIYD